MTGWPVREVVRQLVELGIQPKVSGSGLLAHQDPPPGGVVDKGASVALVFEPAS
jgi:cell division protein FtsI (penicillin-binding protein 3)